jgi:hypothetical protein
MEGDFNPLQPSVHLSTVALRKYTAGEQQARLLAIPTRQFQMFCYASSHTFTTLVAKPKISVMQPSAESAPHA